MRPPSHRGCTESTSSLITFPATGDFPWLRACVQVSVTQAHHSQGSQARDHTEVFYQSTRVPHHHVQFDLMQKLILKKRITRIL